MRVLGTDAAVLLQGLVQSLFQAAMFCFVLLWVPMLTAANDDSAASTGDVPIGLMFACLMVCIMVGSAAYAKLRGAGLLPVDIALVRTLAGPRLLAGNVRQLTAVVHAQGVIILACAALATPIFLSSLPATTVAWLLFEFCVGMSFPAYARLCLCPCESF